MSFDWGDFHVKNWFTRKNRLLAETIVASASLATLAGPAMAQDAAAPPELDTAEEEIVVTGSRIPRPNLVGVTPVAQVGAEEIMSRGVTRIEDMLNQLPQAYAAEMSGVANGAAGTAQADLRNLGSPRTLVLIDGRRLVPGDPGDNTNSAAVDLNAIPAALVQRVEVLTGGASAVYGADAVAGVVNFIMLDDFEGVRFDAQYSLYQHNNDDDETGDLAARAEINPRFFRVPDDNVMDGETADFSFIVGANSEDGRGNVTAYAGYRNVKQILQGERGFSACSFSTNSTPALLCGGSSTSFPTRLQPATNQATIINGVSFFGQFVEHPRIGGRVPNPDGSLHPFGLADQFNFGPANHYQRPDERYALGAFAHYEVNPHVEIYTQLMFMDDRTVAQIAPSGLFRFAGSAAIGGLFPVNCDNPFLSAGEIDFICNADAVPDIFDNPNTAQDERQLAIDAIVAEGDDPATAQDESDPAVAAGLVDATLGFNGANCPDPDPVTPGNQALCIVSLAHRNVNGQPRQDDLRHTMYRAVLGFRGELVEGWSYDVYGQYGTTIYQDHFLNEVSLSRVNKALVNIGGECGVNVDADPINDDLGCVPLDVFSASGPTAEQLAYVVAPGFKMGSTTQQVLSASLTGDLGAHGVRSPWTEDGVDVAFGAEYRREASELRPDLAFCPGTETGTVSDLMGQGATTCPVAGAYDVIELYGEARIPLVQDQPFFHQLGIELAYRYSDYSTGVQTDTYKIGGDWAPIEDLRFRGGFNRAVRAPNIVELFAPQVVGLDGTTDPCAGEAPTASAADCEFTGVAPTQYGLIAANPSSQYNGLVGGNPDLKPETADTVTAGFVFTPSFVSGLSLTVDWYNIKIADRIGGIGADSILLTCLNTHDPFFCGLVNRDPASGQLWGSPLGFITDVNLNAGEIETSGYDIEAAYRFDFADWGMADASGGLSINFVGTYLEEYIVTPLGAASFDCAGLFGPVCSGAIGGFGNPLPEWRHKLRVAWHTPWPALELSGTWRHVGETTLDPASEAAALTQPPVTDLVLGARSYFDLSGSWDIRDNVTLRAGINNVLDEDPPLVGGSNCPGGPCSGNTFPGLYDSTGRYIFFGITADF